MKCFVWFEDLTILLARCKEYRLYQEKNYLNLFGIRHMFMKMNLRHSKMWSREANSPNE